MIFITNISNVNNTNIIPFPIINGTSAVASSPARRYNDHINSPACLEKEVQLLTSPIKVNVTLYNHDGTWSARGDYKDPITGRRVRKSKTLRLKVANSTKRKAVAMLPEIKAQWEAELNSNVVSDDPTFAESVERWLEAKSKTVKENTMVAYTGYANKHIIPMLGHIKTKDIQYAHLQRLHRRSRW